VAGTAFVQVGSLDLLALVAMTIKTGAVHRLAEGTGPEQV
jgi:hypothetical protein